MESGPDSAAAQPAVSLRPAVAGDMAAVQRIYAHHVLTGFASFEETPPDVAEMTRRWTAIVDAGLPYLCAVERDRVLGYAYAGPYRPRSAYRFCVEDSIYLAPDATGRGIGRALLNRLIAGCTEIGTSSSLPVRLRPLSWIFQLIRLVSLRS